MASGRALALMLYLFKRVNADIRRFEADPYLSALHPVSPAKTEYRVAEVGEQKKKLGQLGRAADECELCFEVRDIDDRALVASGPIQRHYPRIERSLEADVHAIILVIG